MIHAIDINQLDARRERELGVQAQHVDAPADDVFDGLAGAVASPACLVLMYE